MCQDVSLEGRESSILSAGNLNITSLQDTSSFDAEQKSAGFTLSLCVPPFCYGASSGSVSSAKNQISRDLVSVGEQSGIKAGDQGFQVAVKGDTALTGAAVASTDTAVEEGKNRFTTGGTLKTEDIQNHAEYDAQGYAVTLAEAAFYRVLNVLRMPH